MAQEIINVGAAPDDGTGDTLRAGGEKINANFSELYAAVGSLGGSAGAPLNGVASGLGITYEPGTLDFAMSAGTAYIDGDEVVAIAQTITLDAADATNPRFDVLYLDNTGTFGKLTGTPAASPSKPVVDPTTQLELTFVRVDATATDLDTIITTELVYDEGSEWTATATGFGWTINSTNNPLNGTKSVEGTTITSGAYAKFVRSSPMSFDGDGNLIFPIRSKATWGAKRSLTIQFFLAGVAKGGAISIKTGQYGFDSAVTTGYQSLVIPKSVFAIAAGTNIDEIRVTAAGSGGSAIGCYLDVIKLQTVAAGSGGGGGASGFTQDQADARYLKQGSNLSDVASPSTARANIGAAPNRITPEVVSGTTYTFVAADLWKRKGFTNAAAITATVDHGVHTVGDRIRCAQDGAGQVTLAAGANVTLHSADNALKSRVQYSEFEIECISTGATDVFSILGDVTV